MLADLPAGTAVACIRLRSLGDALLTTPALRALKQWRPDLRLAYVVEPAWAPVFAGNADVDRLILAPRGTAGRLRAARELRRFAPSVALDWHGGLTAACLTRASGARWRAGYLGRRNAWAHNLLVPPETLPPGQIRQHTVEHAAALLRALGLPAEPRLGPLRLAPSPEVRRAVRSRLSAAGLVGPYAFINAATRSPTMRWPAQRYVELLRWLEREWGLAAVLAREAAISHEGVEETILAGLVPGAAALLTGTSVADLIALIAESSLFIGGDGGPLHIAAACGKPTVALFSSTDAVVWAPWETPHRLVRNEFPCSPCRSDRCRAFARPECVLSIEQNQVRRAVSDLLTASSASAQPAALGH